MLRFAICLLAAVPFVSPAARAQSCGDTLVETFDDASNEGSWLWSNGNAALHTSGGNPGAWIESNPFSGGVPFVRSTDRFSSFAGDWRAQGVTAVGVDLKIESPFFLFCSGLHTMTLVNDGGTPGSTPDDIVAELFLNTGGECLLHDWRSFTIDVDASAPSLPPGWTVTKSPGLSDDMAWFQLTSGVTRVKFQPDVNAISGPWSLGIDNPRLSFQGSPTTYCEAQQNSLGCSAALTWQGQPSVSSSAPFDVTATQLVPGATGVFFYGHAATEIPTLGGLVCILPPILRTPVQGTGGTGGSCSGDLSIDVNAYVQSGVDPALVAGANVHLQAWSRDTGSPFGGSSLTNALRFTVCP